MTDKLNETNVWKVTVESDEDPEDGYTFYLAASDAYEDALEIFKLYQKEYDLEGYRLIELKYLGALYHLIELLFQSSEKVTEK
jgi:hypothetical protein